MERQQLSDFDLLVARAAIDMLRVVSDRRKQATDEEKRELNRTEAILMRSLHSALRAGEPAHQPRIRRVARPARPSKLQGYGKIETK